MSESTEASWFTVEVRAGRLLQARVYALPTVEAAQRYSAVIRTHTTPLAAKGPILCADHRPVVVYPPAVADYLAGLFRDMNSILTRIAVVAAPTNATLSMQLGRIIRDAKNPSRRLFTNPAEARSFLHEVLTKEERDAVDQFLREVR
jgi:hypothetical protein